MTWMTWSESCDAGPGGGDERPTFILCDSSDDCPIDQDCVVGPRDIPFCGGVL